MGNIFRLIWSPGKEACAFGEQKASVENTRQYACEISKESPGIYINLADSRGSVHRPGNTCNYRGLTVSKTVPSIGKKEI